VTPNDAFGSRATRSGSINGSDANEESETYAVLGGHASSTQSEAGTRGDFRGTTVVAEAVSS
jgi:hypothetical protein